MIKLYVTIQLSLTNPLAFFLNKEFCLKVKIRYIELTLLSLLNPIVSLEFCPM